MEWKIVHFGTEPVPFEHEKKLALSERSCEDQAIPDGRYWRARRIMPGLELDELKCI